jgi:hypothetical protein
MKQHKIITATSERQHEERTRLINAWRRHRDAMREIETDWETTRRLESLRDYD